MPPGSSPTMKSGSTTRRCLVRVNSNCSARVAATGSTDRSIARICAKRSRFAPRSQPTTLCRCCARFRGKRAGPATASCSKPTLRYRACCSTATRFWARATRSRRVVFRSCAANEVPVMRPSFAYGPRPRSRCFAATRRRSRRCSSASLRCRSCRRDRRSSRQRSTASMNAPAFVASEKRTR